MKTTTAMAMLLGCFTIAAAPAAEAHGDRDREWRDRHDHRQHFAVDARELRVLTRRLERVTDDLVREMQHLAGPIHHHDRHEAKALRAARRLEMASDELAREARQLLGARRHEPPVVRWAEAGEPALEGLGDQLLEVERAIGVGHGSSRPDSARARGGASTAPGRREREGAAPRRRDGAVGALLSGADA